MLGCGTDYIYPPENKEIYEEIIATGGAIVSEYPNGTEPDSDKFRKRNRIVSGLSLGVLIVEAEKRSRNFHNCKICKRTREICILHTKRNRKFKRSRDK